jgi:hypothetical protein
MAKQDLDHTLAVLRRFIEAAELTVKELESAQKPVAAPPQPQADVVYSGLNVDAYDNLMFTAKEISVIRALRLAAGSRMTPELRQAVDELLREIVDRNTRLRTSRAA